MINPNEPAFPFPIADGYGSYFLGINSEGNNIWSSNQPALTIRAYMAIQFMAAWIKSYSAGSISEEELAKYSVNSADALIAELNKTTTNE